MAIKYFSKLLFLFAVFLCLLAPQNANAELYNSKHNKKSEDVSSVKPSKPSEAIDNKPVPTLDSITATHIQNMSVHCVNSWEKEACLKELSSVSMSMATSYAEALDAGNKKSFLEPLKQHCAASTAALEITVPAYAMKSAITECVNTVSDINKTTSISPNLNLYQLLVGSVICLSKDKSCNDIETSISRLIAN